MEKKMTKKYLSFAFLMITLLLSCSKQDENWLVKVKDQTVRDDIFMRRYKMSREFGQHPVITPEIVKQFVEKTLLNNLFFQAEGNALKLDQDSTIAEQICQEERRMLTRNNGPLFKAVVPANFTVSEEEIQKAYDWGKEEYNISHILVKSPSLADSIYSALMNGADFGSMVTRYSMDMNTIENGGRIAAWLSWSQLAPASAEAVRNTPTGSCTKPILGGFGYQIMRVDERRPREQPDLEQARAEIEGNLRNQKQGLFIEEYTAGLFTRFNLVIDSLLFVRISPALAGTKPGVKVDYALITPEDQKKTLVSWKGGQWSVRETLDKYLQMTRGNAYRLTRYEDVADFAKKANLQELMLLDAKERKLDQTEEYKKDFLYARNQLLGQKCRERLITRVVKVTEQEITDFYENHKSEYNDRPLVELRSTLRSRIYSTKMAELQEKVTSDLRKKYPEKWNEKALKKAAETLNAEKAANPGKPGTPPPGMGGGPGQRPGRGGDVPPAPPQGVR